MVGSDLSWMLAFVRSTTRKGVRSLTLPQSESPWPATVVRCCILTHSVLVTPADSTSYWWGTRLFHCSDETLVCWSLSASQMSKRATTLKEMVNQAANPCACSHSRVPPTPHAFSLYLSRTHIHTASVIADPCKLCVARTRLRAQGVSMGVPCA